MRKRNLIIVTVFVIFLILFSAYLMLSPLLNTNNQEEPLIGGQTDSNGCLGPAGYSWNDSIGACIREWELDSSQREAAKIAVLPLSSQFTIVGVETLNCPGCFKIKLQRNDNNNQFIIELSDWKPIDSNKNNACKNYSVENCPNDCVVCPPCEVCSSISCQSKEFCNSIGFNETWYREMVPNK